MTNLTIADIHHIRKEHAMYTQTMNFDEYKADLHKEIKPLLDLLKTMKTKSTVAAPQATYLHKRQTGLGICP